MCLLEIALYTGGGGANVHNPNVNSQKCTLAKQQYNILDYAGGVGSLARILSKYYDIDVLVYEEYMSEFKNDGLVNYIQRDKLGKYDVVINSAMFEHITKREHLDHINSLVSEHGTLIVHTLVRENIPKNPNWFYIQPVHCSFHTNKSMQILMNDWGYSHSLYSPISKCWVMFKIDNPSCNKLERYAEDLNSKLQQNYFFYKKGFVDYWLD
ncbi:class I SAM-dependent methyltransferase [Helicobacter muridarum]|uniref:Class I SAM-dependent methyltransferase n=1 Tax=Helicobacter muridarum TaxID=216 RepID=A0A4U8TGK6_9HELI|nr:class I SAM-dependent methyltransferase [Helicobacter muridarum]